MTTTTAVLTRRGEFRNEPLTDFSRPENRAAMQQALEKVSRELGREYPLLIAGQEIRTGETFVSRDPSHPGRVVGVFYEGTPELAGRAVEEAARAFEHWKRVPFEQRAECLFRAAELLRQRRFELDAWIIYEVGKTWPEADADVAETIDFFEYYGREMLRLGGPQPLTPVPGERNWLRYIPLGVGAVIPPWNFPAAITGGMTSASLVTGNTVVLKPSSDSPAIAYQLASILYEAGIPREVLSVVTGGGSTVGEALVRHPRTRFIAFTGSKAVGIRISELAGQVVPGQIWIKRAVLEMGGKDAIIVDSEADLDAALEGVVISAFGYQGQKCSACSRLILDEAVYDRFLERLVERTRALRVGPAEQPENFMGPVINERAMQKILDYIAVGRQEGRLVAGGERLPGDGYFIAPTIIADVDPRARIAQEEIFGPVLAVIRARDFEHALAIANDTEYGLTGAVYSRNRAKLERAAEEFHVGNLYLNRKCTGALVGGHPFGGFNMSGTDSKAGGPDYLLLFLQGKVVSERLNTT
jgi:1-pyrroline-5-carboxylate dehydrogenase